MFGWTWALDLLVNVPFKKRLAVDTVISRAHVKHVLATRDRRPTVSCGRLTVVMPQIGAHVNTPVNPSSTTPRVMRGCDVGSEMHEP